MDVREGLEILRTLRDNAQNIDKDLLQHNENPLAEEIEESLPLKSLEELFRLEEALKDENYKKAFVSTDTYFFGPLLQVSSLNNTTLSKYLKIL